MKSLVPVASAASSAPLRSRFRLALFRPIVAAVLLGSLAHAQTITSAVPGVMAYQSKVTNANGSLVGAGTPVNRTVIFRIWDHASNSTVSNLVYSEQQTVTISEGEFSALIGAGTAVSATPLGFSEASKGPPNFTVASAAVFGGATRYLGVTIDDGTSNADPEVSPRQQLVTSAYAFRAKYAETVGSNGANTLTALDNGNVGVGTSNPAARLEVVGNVRTGSASNPAFQLSNNVGTLTTTLGTATAASGYSNDAAAGDTILRTENGGKLLLQTGTGASALTVASNNAVGIGVTAPNTAGGAWANGRLSVDGNISLRGAAGGNNWADQRLLFGGDGTGHGLHIGSINNSGAINPRMLSFYDSGRLAMGTTNPLGRLGYPAGWRGSDIVPSSSAVSILEGTDAARLHLRNASGTANTTQDFVIDNTGNIIHMQWLGSNLSSRGTVMAFDTNGNVGIGTTPSSKLHVAGGIKVDGNNVIEFGAGVAGKEGAAGKIGYQTFTADALDIVGAGTTGSSRKIKFWNEGGAFFGGSVGVSIDPADITSARLVVGFNTAGHDRSGLTGAYINNGIASNATTHGAHNLSIRTAASIWCGNTVIATSDQRVKTTLGRSQGATDLRTLLGIEITDFNYIDTIAHGTTAQKKVIAQQVEKVFPQAISQRTGVVADIFRTANVREGWIQLETALKKGDRVRLLGDNVEGVYEVLETKPGSFRATVEPKSDKIFVYGREVSDFRTVDYDAIAMLNVSATQELARQNDALRTANEKLEQRVAELEARDRARDAKLASIEKLLSSGQTVMARPAATTSNASGQE